MIIEKLERTPMQDQYGNVYGERLPSDYEIMNKINEAIDALNQLLALHKIDYKEE